MHKVKGVFLGSVSGRQNARSSLGPAVMRLHGLVMRDDEGVVVSEDVMLGRYQAVDDGKDVVGGGWVCVTMYGQCIVPTKSLPNGTRLAK